MSREPYLAGSRSWRNPPSSGAAREWCALPGHAAPEIAQRILPDLTLSWGNVSNMNPTSFQESRKSVCDNAVEKRCQYKISIGNTLQ